MVQRVNDLVLSPQWLGSLLWYGFDPWLGNFHTLWAQSDKKNTTKPGNLLPVEELFISLTFADILKDDYLPNDSSY